MGRVRGLLLLCAMASNALTETSPDGNIPADTRHTRTNMRRTLRIGMLLAGFCLTLVLHAQTGAKDGEWRAYGGDEASTRYSPLDQINADTVKTLQMAWSWKFDNFGATNQEINTTETTPLMVNGMLYFTAGQRRNVIAVKADTGETIWVWRPDEGERFDRAPRKIHRGVA